MDADPDDLIPLIFPADFSDTTLSSGRLLPESAQSALVGLGWDRPDFFELAPKTVAFETHRARALANLRGRTDHSAWASEVVPGPDGPVRCLMLVGDETTASNLLDLEVLRAGMQMLAAKAVFIAAPTRVAMVMSEDRVLAAHLCITRIEHFAEDEFVIGPQIYAFDGQTLTLDGLVGRPGDSEPGANVRRLNRRSARRALATPTTLLAFDEEVDEPADESLGYMPQGMWFETKGGELSMLLTLSEPDVESVKRKINVLLKRRLGRYLATPKFGGVIRFQLDPERIDPTEVNTEALQRLLRRKTRQLERKGYATPAGDTVLLVGSIGEPERAAARPSKVKRAPGSSGGDPHWREPVESEQRLRVRRLLGVSGAVVILLAVGVRFVVASGVQGAGLFFERQVLAPLGCLVLGVLMLRGSAYGRFGLLGWSVAACLATVLTAGRSFGAVATVDHTLAFVFALAALCSAAGLGVEARGRVASEPRYRGVLGLIIGALLVVVTRADTRRCTPRYAVLGGQRGCRDLPRASCATVPGCRVIPPTPVPNCPPALCAPAECEGSPLLSCYDYPVSVCPAGLCERRGF